MEKIKLLHYEYHEDKIISITLAYSKNEQTFIKHIPVYIELNEFINFKEREGN